MPDYPQTSKTITLIVADIPALRKAVNFLFDDGSKILRERRERQKIKTDDPMSNPKTIKLARILLRDKSSVLSSEIPQTNWLRFQSEVENLLRALEVNAHDYQTAKENYVNIDNTTEKENIEQKLLEAESSFAKSMKSLQSLLTDVCDRVIFVAEVERI